MNEAMKKIRRVAQDLERLSQVLRLGVRSAAEFNEAEGKKLAQHADDLRKAADNIQQVWGD